MNNYSDEEIERMLRSDDELEALIGLRDYLVHELVGHRCPRCQSSQLRTGDTAALTLRFTQVRDRIEQLQAARKAQETGKVVGLAAIRGGRAAGGTAPKDSASSRHGTKNAPRRSRGSGKTGS